MKNITKIFIMTLLVVPFLLTSCSDPDLPYPLDDVEHGVLVDISRIPGTMSYIDAVAPTVPDPELGVRLSIVPKGDGPWESLNVAMIYQTIDTTFVYDEVVTDSVVDLILDSRIEKVFLAEGITSLPIEIDISYPDLLNQFGMAREHPGDLFTVVADITLPSGLVLWGWTPVTGFSNSDFASWSHDGKAFSRRVQYPAACPVTPDLWTGPALSQNITWGVDMEGSISILDSADRPSIDFWEFLLSEEDFEAEVYKKIELIGLLVDNWWGNPTYANEIEGTASLKIWITSDFDVYIPAQKTGLLFDIGTAIGGAPDVQEMEIQSHGEIQDAMINSCNGFIEFGIGWFSIGDSGYGFGDTFYRITSLVINPLKNILAGKPVSEEEMKLVKE